MHPKNHFKILLEFSHFRKALADMAKVIRRLERRKHISMAHAPKLGTSIDI